MIKEFKDFAMRGNVMDLAIGVILGAAFGKIVSSFVNDILMPPLGLLMGKVDFTNLFVTLSGQTYPTLAAAKAGGAVTLNVGLFLNAIVDFTLVAFAIFLMIKQVNRWKPQAPAPAAKKDCPFCFSGIHLNATRCPQCTSEIPKPVSADIEKEKS